MIWHNVEQFLAMGGYGPYVWGSVLVTGTALAVELALLSRRKQAALAAAVLSARLRSRQAAHLAARGRQP